MEDWKWKITGYMLTFSFLDILNKIVIVFFSKTKIFTNTYSMADLRKKDLADLIKKAKKNKSSIGEGAELYDSYIKEAQIALSQLSRGEKLSSSQKELYKKLEVASFPWLYQDSQF